MVDCKTKGTSIEPFMVPRKQRGQLNVEAIEKSLAASQQTLEGIVQSSRHGYPACVNGWSLTSYTATPVRLRVAPKPGIWFQNALYADWYFESAFLEAMRLSFCALWLAQLKLFL